MDTDTTDRPPLTVVLLVASVRSTRIAEPLAAWVRTGADRHPGIVLDVVDLAEHVGDIPPADLAPGGPRTAVADRLSRADAFVVLTPEYNHSFPGSLKDAIDWHLAEWARKPVGFVSYGASSGGLRAVEQLRQVFPEVRATTTRDGVALRAPWTRLEDGRFTAEDGEERALDATFTELAWWGRALRAARAADPVPA